jgi:hypothetical protein
MPGRILIRTDPAREQKKCHLPRSEEMGKLSKLKIRLNQGEVCRHPINADGISFHKIIQHKYVNQFL